MERSDRDLAKASRYGDREAFRELVERYQRKLVSVAWPDGVLMNVNFPKLPSAQVNGIRVARQGRRPSGIEIVPTKDPVGRSYLWIGDYISDESLEEDTDLYATRNGEISITPLHLDLTHAAAFKRLKKVFA